MTADLVNVLLQFQPDDPEFKKNLHYDQAARNFISQLQNVSASHWNKGADTPQDVLTILDPGVNTIGYAFTLVHRFTPIIQRGAWDVVAPGGPLWTRLTQFLETADSVQLRYVGVQWRKLVEFTEAIANSCQSPGLAISPMRSAMIRLDPTTGTFTSTHLRFIQLCMETRSYAAAEPILNNYIHTLPAKIPDTILHGLEYSVPCEPIVSSGDYIHAGSGHTHKITLADVQEYYILGAMAYLGLRQFKKAQQFLEHVLVIPANNAANGFMLEAYKKWVLIGCLVDETPRSVPRTANGAAIKLIKSASKAYDALAEAYGQLGNLPKLNAQIKAGADIWIEDGNQGLVTELMNNQMRTYVTRLSKTFSAIPVLNIANHVGSDVDEIAQYLNKLIQDGHLNAQLEQNDRVGAVLRFYLDPTKGPLAKSEKEQQQALFVQTERTNVLAKQVKDADYRMTLTKEYIENLKRHNKRQTQGGDAMDTAWDDGVDAEEDIMVDLR